MTESEGESFYCVEASNCYIHDLSHASYVNLPKHDRTPAFGSKRLMEACVQQQFEKFRSTNHNDGLARQLLDE